MKTLLKISLQDLCRIKEPARVKQGPKNSVSLDYLGLLFFGMGWAMCGHTTIHSLLIMIPLATSADDRLNIMPSTQSSLLG